MNRYEGKPFLRLLECYVLAVIDQLDETQRQTLQQMESKLSEIYGHKGNWQQIIHEEMGFPESLPMKMREVWEQNLSRMHAIGKAVDPNDFAMTFVDQNFSKAST